MGRWAARGACRRLGRSDRSVVDESMERLGPVDLRTRRPASLLLLDEPDAGLDADARSWITAAVAAEVAEGSRW